MILEKSQRTPSVTTWRRSVTATCPSEYARLYKPHLYFEISAILNVLFWSFGHFTAVTYLHSEAHKKLFDLQRLKGRKRPLCWWHCCFHARLPKTASNNWRTGVLPLALHAVGVMYALYSNDQHQKDKYPGLKCWMSLTYQHTIQ